MGFDWVEINIETDAGGMEIASELLLLLGCTGTAIEAVPDATHLPSNIEHQPLTINHRPLTIVRGYLPSTERTIEQIDWLYERLAVAKQEGLTACEPRITTQFIEGTKWQEAWKQSITPLAIGNKFWVKPSWLDEAPPEGRIVLSIDAAGGFGTGHHPTTQMCLELLEAIDLWGKSVLDVGCGSGILSIAAAKLGAINVLAVDIDPQAVRCTQQNAHLNGVLACVRVGESDLLSEVLGSFDVVLANIVTEAVLRLLGELEVKPVLKEGGLLIASGISAERREEIVRAFERHHFEVVKVKNEEGWTAISAQRQRPA